MIGVTDRINGNRQGPPNVQETQCLGQAMIAERPNSMIRNITRNQSQFMFGSKMKEENL